MDGTRPALATSCASEPHHARASSVRAAGSVIAAGTEIAAGWVIAAGPVIAFRWSNSTAWFADSSTDIGCIGEEIRTKFALNL